MTNETKRARIIHEINETARQLQKAEKRFNNSVQALIMEAVENDTRGSLNDWIDYCYHDKVSVRQKEAHMAKLEKMLSEIEAA